MQPTDLLAIRVPPVALRLPASPILGFNRLTSGAAAMAPFLTPPSAEPQA